MRLFLIVLLVSFSYKYQYVATSYGGRTMQIKKKEGVHVFEDDLNITLLYSHKKIAIIQRGVIFIYKRVHDSDSSPMYYMNNRCKGVPNKVMVIQNRENCKLYIKYYYHSNNRGVEHTKTEIYSSVVITEYSSKYKTPKANNRSNCKKRFN